MSMYILGAIILLLLLIVIKYNNTEGLTQQLNLCFYTCFYGNENNEAFQIPPIPSDKYKCYFYTNNKILLEEINDTKWIGIYDNINTKDNDIIDSCMKGKKVKVTPNHYKELNNFNYTCFYDSKYGLVDELIVEQLIDMYFIKKSYALLLRKHPFVKDSIYNELYVSLTQQRYLSQLSQYITYINKQLENKLSATTDIHACCGFLIRNMKHSKINDINNTWYKHIQDCGIQDQLSFFFIKQIYNNDIFVFDDNICKNKEYDFRCNLKTIEIEK